MILPPVDSYRCLCGLSLWATERTAHPAAWSRHLAHIDAFQNGQPWWSEP